MMEGLSSRPVRVILKERPFDGAVRILPVGDNGQSIAKILAAQADLPPQFAERCVARINDHIVPRDMWHRVRLKPEANQEVIVTFTLPIRGGGGGGGGHKNVIGTVASVAVLLVAAAVSGGALGLPAAGFLSAGAVNSVVAGAIALGGDLAIGRLPA